MSKVKIEKKITEIDAPQNRCFADAPQNRYSYKLWETHKKTPVLGPPFNKVACPLPATLLKKRVQHKYFSVLTLHAFKFSRRFYARKFL